MEEQNGNINLATEYILYDLRGFTELPIDKFSIGHWGTI
jgi:hypothetical protein